MANSGSIVEGRNWDFKGGLGAGREAIKVVELSRGDAYVHNFTGHNGGGRRPKEDKGQEKKSNGDSIEKFD